MTQQSLQNLPIDIHFNKLLDWLINRRHCTQQCQTILTVIRDKVVKTKEATLEENHTNKQIQEILALPQLTYFQVKELFELLKTTEAGKTNLIGQYSNQNMKDWAEIMKLYAKDGTFMAEAALMIVRNANYEVPAIKKQIGKCQQTQKDCIRKENEYASSAADMQRQYAASCKQLGIKGEKIKTELASLVKDLPTELHKFADSAKSLEGAVQFYDKFASFLMNNPGLESENVSLLKHLIRKGNTTTFEWRTGRAPVKVEEQTVAIDLSDEQEANTAGEDADIDWGATDAIDFGDQIDFDLGDITVESGGVLAADGEIELENPDIDTIDWGAVDDVEITATDGVKDQGSEADIASGKDALSVLDNPETRNQFVDDLLELQGFLTQRLTELRHGSGEGSHMASAPSDLHVSEDEVAVMLSEVKSILEQLMAHQMQHLLLIRDSPSYVDRLRDSLRQKLALAEKMTLAQKDMVGQQHEAEREASELDPQLELLRTQTKAIKKQLEEEISKKYNDRKVNIIGEVNTL